MNVKLYHNRHSLRWRYGGVSDTYVKACSQLTSTLESTRSTNDMNQPEFDTSMPWYAKMKSAPMAVVLVLNALAIGLNRPDFPNSFVVCLLAVRIRFSWKCDTSSFS